MRVEVSGLSRAELRALGDGFGDLAGWCAAQGRSAMAAFFWSVVAALDGEERALALDGLSAMELLILAAVCQDEREEHVARRESGLAEFFAAVVAALIREKKARDAAWQRAQRALLSDGDDDDEWTPSLEGLDDATPTD